MNTIIFDNELESVEKLIHNLYEIGVDALIIQDMAILKMNLPPIPLHASTQCNNDSIEKIKFLEKCNLERVVLPREFSLKEIEEVKTAQMSSWKFLSTVLYAFATAGSAI